MGRKKLKLQTDLPILTKAAEVAAYLRPQLLTLEQECFWAFALNPHTRLLGCELVAKGTVDQVQVYARDVFRFAIRANAAAVLLAHNHPSDQCVPSDGDIRLTRHMQRIGRLLDMPVLDHVIVARTTCVSISDWLGDGWNSFKEGDE